MACSDAWEDRTSLCACYGYHDILLTLQNGLKKKVWRGVVVLYSGL
jgi:hypothetical protein